MEKLFAVFGMLANAGKDTVFKVAAGQDGGSRTNLFYALKGALIAVMALFLLLFVKREPLIHVPSLPWAIPIAALVYVSYMLALRSLVYGTASTNITIFRLNFVLTAVIAAPLFREALSLRKLGGLALCLGAIMIFFWGGRRGNGEGSSRAEARAVVKGILLAVGASVSGACLNNVNKLALNAGASIFHLVFYRYLIVCVIGACAIAVRRQSAIPSRKLLAASAGAAALMLASLYFLLTALSTGEVTLVIPISQLSFLFTALLSFILLKEKLNGVKAAGILLAVASIGVIA